MEMGLKMPSRKFDDESFRVRRTSDQFEVMGATPGRTLDRMVSHPLGCRLRWGVRVCYTLLGIRDQNESYVRPCLNTRVRYSLGE